MLHWQSRKRQVIVRGSFYEMTNGEYAAFGVKNYAVLRYDFPDEGEEC